MDIKKLLKDNNITQSEFADYIDMSRIGLNKTLNNKRKEKLLLNSVKILLAEKQGVQFDIVEEARH
jgi:transcriptional regulator with XRE-family HTH domain